MTDRDTYALLQAVSIKTSMAAVCTLMDNLADQMCDVEGMDEEREEIRAIFARCDRLYEGIRDKIRRMSE